MLVKNSELVISPDILIKSNKKKEDEKEDDDSGPGMIHGIFIPTANPRSKVLLYVKFVYRGIEKVLIYDHR